MSRDTQANNLYPPMPNLVGDEEDTLAAANVARSRSNSNTPGMSNPTQEMSVVTKTTSHTHYISWAIDSRSLRIARLAGKGEKRGVIEASVERNGHEFKLELCASGWRNSQDGYSAFYLTVKDEGETFVARYRVHVGEITRISSIRHDFHLGVGFPNFCEQTALESIILNDNLNFVVTVEVFNCQSQVVPMRRPDIPHPERLQYLSDLLENIYKHRLHTDVTLVCGRRRIPAHKAVLAAASPVFQAMFEHSFVEKTCGEVTLNEFVPETVEAMVRFLYTAQLSHKPTKMSDESEDDLGGDLSDDLENDENNSCAINGACREGQVKHRQSPLRATSSCLSVGATTAMLSGFQMEVDGKNDEMETDKGLTQSEDYFLEASDDPHVFNLFRFGEMYKITSLVIACCQKMHSTIRVDNTCSLLIKLDRYSHVPEIGKIQESIWEYVKNNYHEIKETMGFQTLLKHHPNVVRQLMDKLL